MKIILANGRELIKSSPAHSGVGHHDAWGSHAAETPEFYIWDTASGLFVLALTVSLKAGDAYYWVVGQFPNGGSLPVEWLMSSTEANNIVQEYSTKPAPNSPVAGQGEWFNFVYRPRVWAKFTPDEFNAYRASR